MCFYFRQSVEAQRVAQRYNVSFEQHNAPKQQEYNGFSHPKTMVICHNKPTSIQYLEWGLIPFWAKEKSIQNYTLNAKIETLHQKPSFKQVLHNRCLVIADGFYEWQWLDPKGKKKQKHLITLPTEELFSFGGIWSSWTDRDSGEIKDTYSIITKPANAMMSKIHNSKQRMPLILPVEEEKGWLNGKELAHFLHSDVLLKAYAI